MIISIIRSQGISPRDKFLLIVAFFGAALVAIIVHELAHGYIAKKNGDYTAVYDGRMTFNPVAHFDLLGMLMFCAIGIGWAKPVPINPNNFRNRKKGLFWVSIAGVVSNFILAAICFALWLLVIVLGFTDGIVGTLLINFFYYGTTINISLIAFNLLPIFPLDGFRLVEIFTKPTNRYRQFMYRFGFFVYIALFCMGILADITGLYYLDVLGIYLTTVNNLIIKLFSWVGGLFL